MATKPVNPVKIVHITRRFAQSIWGGQESVIFNLCRQQAAIGWKPEVHTTLIQSAQERETWRDVPIHRHPHRFAEKGKAPEERGLLDETGDAVSPQLERAVSHLDNIRLIHSHSTGLLGAGGYEIARKKKVPFVLTVHRPEQLQASGKRQTGLFGPLGIGKKLERRELLNAADAIFCVGDQVSQEVADMVEHDRIHYMPNGVAVERFEENLPLRDRMRADLGVPPASFLIGCISRIRPEKDQETLVEAFINCQDGKQDVRLVVAGSFDDEAYLAKLKKRVADAGLKNKVIFREPEPPESSGQPALFAALDAFVLPSRDEVFGIVVLEAWASRRPVVATRAGGLRRLIHEEENGICFDAGDVDQLTICLKRLVNSRELTATLANNGFKTANDSFSWKHVAGEVEAVYAKLCKL